MVLAHELAHLRARDPIAAAGGGAALTLLLLALGGDAEALAPQLARLVQLGYSRQAEARADEAAIAALLGHYGHAGGAAGLFEALADYDGAGRELPALLATHPADAARIARLQEAARGWTRPGSRWLPCPRSDSCALRFSWVRLQPDNVRMNADLRASEWRFRAQRFHPAV